MTHHLGYEKHAPEGKHSDNFRNGKSSKRIKSKRGQIEIDVPRDRNSEFEPHLIKKWQTRFDGFDDKIISTCARGMTCREIKAYLQEIYGVEVSPDLISTVMDGVIDKVRTWQSRRTPPNTSVLPSTPTESCAGGALTRRCMTSRRPARSRARTPTCAIIWLV